MPDWSRLEVEATVTTYFSMLTRELQGEPVNKREYNRQLMRLLNDRSAGAVEFKHCNISAVLLELGCIPIDGYKPRGNYQELLRDVVMERLANARLLHQLMQNRVAEPAATYRKRPDPNHVIVEAPTPLSGDRQRTPPPPGLPQLHLGVDYLAQEARNASLGRAGEEFVVQVEHERLWRAGRRQLADRIDHVARTKGDGLGYDVLSFEVSGQERLIEVKTTRLGPLTPFFATSNEVQVSEAAGNYQLYRVFRFDADPKLFILPGPLDRSCALAPTQYRVSLR